MPTQTLSLHPVLRGPALIAGSGLLAMILLAPFANFYVVEGLVARADAALTVANLRASGELFRWGIGVFLVVALLDVIVAWGLHDLLAASDASGARLSAWLRITYAAVLVVALAPLLGALRWTQDLAHLTALDPALVQAQVMSAIDDFATLWNLGLAVFGAHLVVLGIVVVRSPIAPSWLGVVVALAGLAYLVDTFVKILFPGLDLSWLMILFFGEAVLMIWLLWRGLRG